ncbi:MAG: SIR2 family protein [Acidobacteria bacterium]|nr:SIR2 family protein [Acidobacteriota bacterium]
MTSTADEEKLREHCDMMIKEMADGGVIPFFGAGVNLTNRLPDVPFSPGENLPSARELARSIADEFKYPLDRNDELMRVSWYAAKVQPRRFRRHLHGIFTAECEPTDAHKFFARLPGRLNAKDYPRRYQLIITTNYDDVLERTFKARREPYDMLSYIERHPDDPRAVGKFMYAPHGGEPEVLWDHNDLKLTSKNAPALDRTMILKIHGAVDRASWERSNFVVTEDNYIDYLRRMTLNFPVPPMLSDKMTNSTFLFLGYSLKDWNMRVLFRSIWPGVDERDTSWAVLRGDSDQKWVEMYWEKHKVELMKMPLSDYFAALTEELDAEWPDASGGVPV